MAIPTRPARVRERSIRRLDALSIERPSSEQERPFFV
jgi:hypothetical protein